MEPLYYKTHFFGAFKFLRFNLYIDVISYIFDFLHTLDMCENNDILIFQEYRCVSLRKQQDSIINQIKLLGGAYRYRNGNSAGFNKKRQYAPLLWCGCYFFHKDMICTHCYKISVGFGYTTCYSCGKKLLKSMYSYDWVNVGWSKNENIAKYMNLNKTQLWNVHQVEILHFKKNKILFE